MKKETTKPIRTAILIILTKVQAAVAMYTQSAGSMFALECRDNSVAHVSTISKQKQSIEPVPPSSAHTVVHFALHSNLFSFFN